MLERISPRLSQVASRQGGLALGLWGEAGVGKTHALERMLKNVPCRVLRFSPHLELDRLLLTLPETPAPAWLEHTLSRVKKGESVDGAALLQALCAALEGLAPLVLVVEDLWQAPLEGREGWDALAARVSRLKGVALLATSREAPGAVWDSVRLEPLDPAQTAALLRAQVGSALPPEVCEWVQARSQGNPSLTLELFRFVAQGGSLYQDGHRWHWHPPPEGRVPLGVEALLLERVRAVRLDPALERTLLAHALLPGADRLERRRALAGLPEPEWLEALTRLEREGLLRGGELHPPMLGAVLEGALNPSERESWARKRIGVLCDPTLEGPPDFLAAVRDLEAAWLEPEAQLELLRGAAGQAEERGYWGRAAELWTEVLRWAAPKVRLTLTRRVAWLLREVRPQEALRHIARVTALAPDDFEAALLELELLALSGRHAEVDAHLQARPELLPRWQTVSLEVRYRLDDMAGVLEVYRRAPEVLSQNPSVQVQVGYALGRQGRGAEALALYQDALENPKLTPLEQARLLAAFATLELQGGELEQAVRHFSQALERLQRLAPSPRLEQQRTVVLHNRSHALYRLRRIPEATRDLEAALEHLNLAGDGQGVAEAQVNLALYHLMSADYRRAEALLSEARPTLERGENPQSLLRLETALLHLNLAEGSDARAVVPLHVRRALTLLGEVAPLEQAQSLYFIGWAEARSGSPEAAEQHARRLEDLCDTHGFVQLKPAADAVRGYSLERRGERQAATKHFERASAQYLALGLTEDADRFGLELDRLRGDAATAAARLERLNAAGLKSWAEVGYRAFPHLAGSAYVLETPVADDIPQLEVLGSLRLMRSNEALPLPAEQGRRLLLTLLEARVLGREGVRVLELLETLYPDHDEQKAENALKQLVYRLRGTLGKRAIVRLRERYALGPLPLLGSDAERFLENTDTRLWRGVALEDFAEDEGAALRDLLHDRLGTLLKASFERDPGEGSRLLELLLLARPFDEVLLEQAGHMKGRLQRLERVISGTGAKSGE